MNLYRAAFTVLVFTMMFSARGYAKSRPIRAVRYTPAPIVVVEEVPMPTTSDTQFRFSSEVSVLQGLESTFGFGGSIGYAFRAGENSPLFLGMDIGFTKWTADYETTLGEGDAKQTIQNTGSVISIPVLFSMYYRLLEGSGSRARPYIGMSMGPSLVSIEDPAIKFGTNPASGKAVDVKFQVLIRPGVDLAISDQISLNFEPKVGIFQGLLLFSPQLGLSWSL